MNQEQYDNEIKNSITAYLMSNNSISGTNFQKFIDSLITLKESWDSEVEQYLNKIKL